MKELILVNKVCQSCYITIDWNNNSLPTDLELMTHKTDAIKSDLMGRATRCVADLLIHILQWNLAET